MLKLLKNKAGLVLAEALLAVAMLGTGAIITASLINNAVSTTLLSKSYLLAQNFATEAIEGVKSIRNANWLNKPNTTACWLTLEPDITIIPEAQCNLTANKVAANTNYRLLQKDNGGWMMQAAQTNQDLDLSNQSLNSNQYMLYQDNSITYKPYILLATATSSPTTQQSATNFYRNVKFTTVDGTTATLQVKVQWREGAKIQTLNRSIVLYNYF